MASANVYRYYVEMVDGFANIYANWVEAEEFPDLEVSIANEVWTYTYSSVSHCWTSEDAYDFYYNDREDKAWFEATSDSPETVILHYINVLEG